MCRIWRTPKLLCLILSRLARPVILRSDKSSKESVRRMAELGVIKRLGKVVRNNDRTRINSSSDSMSMRRDHIVSLKEEPPDERRRTVARSGR